MTSRRPPHLRSRAAFALVLATGATASCEARGPDLETQWIEFLDRVPNALDAASADSEERVDGIGSAIAGGRAEGLFADDFYLHVVDGRTVPPDLAALFVDSFRMQCHAIPAKSERYRYPVVCDLALFEGLSRKIREIDLRRFVDSISWRFTVSALFLAALREGQLDDLLATELSAHGIPPSLMMQDLFTQFVERNVRGDKHTVMHPRVDAELDRFVSQCFDDDQAIKKVVAELGRDAGLPWLQLNQSQQTYSLWQSWILTSEPPLREDRIAKFHQITSELVAKLLDLDLYALDSPAGRRDLRVAAIRALLVHENSHRADFAAGLAPFRDPAWDACTEFKADDNSVRLLRQFQRFEARADRKTLDSARTGWDVLGAMLQFEYLHDISMTRASVRSLASAAPSAKPLSPDLRQALHGIEAFYSLVAEGVDANSFPLDHQPPMIRVFEALGRIPDPLTWNEADAARHAYWLARAEFCGQPRTKSSDASDLDALASLHRLHLAATGQSSRNGALPVPRPDPADYPDTTGGARFAALQALEASVDEAKNMAGFGSLLRSALGLEDEWLQLDLSIVAVAHLFMDALDRRGVALDAIRLRWPESSSWPFPDCTEHSVYCRRDGQCERRGRTCVATSDARCKASKVCAFEGYCKLDQRIGRCVAQSQQDCLRSSVCTTNGRCSLSHGACWALTLAHCQGTTACKRGRCFPMVRTCDSVSPVDLLGLNWLVPTNADFARCNDIRQYDSL